MNENTQKLTFGALLVAVFGVLLVLNRQTGGMLEETFIFLFPIPMVAFSAKYGLRDSLPVFVCTILISIFCGIFTSAFYAVAQSFIGMVYGSCIHAKRDTTRTMLLVMAQQQALDMLMRPDTLLRMMIISMVFLGVVEGFIVCQLSLLILRRLRYPIQKPAPLTSFYPPRWSGFISFIFYIFGSAYLAMPQTTGREEVIRVAGQLCVRLHVPDVLRLHRGSLFAARLRSAFARRQYRPGDPALFHHSPDLRPSGLCL